MPVKTKEIVRSFTWVRMRSSFSRRSFRTNLLEYRRNDQVYVYSYDPLYLLYHPIPAQTPTTTMNVAKNPATRSPESAFTIGNIEHNKTKINIHDEDDDTFVMIVLSLSLFDFLSLRCVSCCLKCSDFGRRRRLSDGRTDGRSEKWRLLLYVVLLSTHTPLWVIKICFLPVVLLKNSLSRFLFNK